MAFTTIQSHSLIPVFSLPFLSYFHQPFPSLSSPDNPCSLFHPNDPFLIHFLSFLLTTYDLHINAAACVDRMRIWRPLIRFQVKRRKIPSKQSSQRLNLYVKEKQKDIMQILILIVKYFIIAKHQGSDLHLSVLPNPNLIRNK